jgi:hypothetical protein
MNQDSRTKRAMPHARDALKIQELTADLSSSIPPKPRTCRSGQYTKMLCNKESDLFLLPPHGLILAQCTRDQATKQITTPLPRSVIRNAKFQPRTRPDPNTKRPAAALLRTLVWSASTPPPHEPRPSTPEGGRITLSPRTGTPPIPSCHVTRHLGGNEKMYLGGRLEW